MWHFFRLTDALEPGESELLIILVIAFMPSIIGLLLAFLALWLPDDAVVLSHQRDDRRHEDYRANDGGPDWRRAA